ncbi:MAG: Nucleoside-diphosphate-sugar pyrophosphorylase family protein [Herbinix sp.]|jgi:dTDP-glucose pyrophosphorylase|nr:Nucleoside-diphosphate-sugar pyrophosphorylase family protein [Herbinix sp.]
MKLENLMVSERDTIHNAVERLEKYRCKIVYVVFNRQLRASISDGDVRRYLLQDGDPHKLVEHIANYSPKYFYENETDEIEEFFNKSELYSVPILNNNQEIVSIFFRNNVIVKSKEKMNIPVIIMAGGKGTRLYPYTKILPKALIPVGELPIAEHIMNRLKDCGCNKYYMIVNHKKNMIKSYFDNIEKDYSLDFIDEDIPMGTGGGLVLLKNKIESDFILSNCDILIDSNYLELYQYHKVNKNFITIVAAKKIDKIPYGVLFTDPDGKYLGTTEKPERNYLINTGFYIVNSRVINEMDYNECIGFPDIIDRYQKKGEKIGIYSISENAFMDMGQIEELELMKKRLDV